MLRCLSAVLLGLAACAGAAPPQSKFASAPAPFEPSAVPAIEVPTEDIPLAILDRTVVARGLRNPRGMLILADGSLLVAEAGSGAPEDALSGTLSLLRDVDGDGDFLDEGERTVLLDQQPSRSAVELTHRDEVFGMGGVARGETTVLAALASDGSSTLFRVDGDAVSAWGTTRDDIHDLDYNPEARQWFAVASSTGEVVRVQSGGGAERVLAIPDLAQGRAPWPWSIRYDRLDSHMLVSLFGGSPGAEADVRGDGLVRAGAIISVDPTKARFTFTVRGLTAPTDFAIASEASLYVLELCDSFDDPAPTRAELLATPNHGGFKRFSGRLLRVDRMHRRVTLIASGLDTPTNLALSHGDRAGTQMLYIAEGMGTPGRPIPGPYGVIPLTGFIERLVIKPRREIGEN